MNTSADNTKPHILMLLENESMPDDNRVLLEAESLIDAGYRVSVICPTTASINPGSRCSMKFVFIAIQNHSNWEAFSVMSGSTVTAYR